jgi:hypothetical protein
MRAFHAAAPQTRSLHFLPREPIPEKGFFAKGFPADWGALGEAV